MQSFIFTAEPFVPRIAWNRVNSREDISSAQHRFRECNCSGEYAWNIADIECINNSPSLKCIQALEDNSVSFEKVQERRKFLCPSKCSKKFVEYKSMNALSIILRTWFSICTLLANDEYGSLIAKEINQIWSASGVDLNWIYKKYRRFILYFGSND